MPSLAEWILRASQIGICCFSSSELLFKSPIMMMPEFLFSISVVMASSFVLVRQADLLYGYAYDAINEIGQVLSSTLTLHAMIVGVHLLVKSGVIQRCFLCRITIP